MTVPIEAQSLSKLNYLLTNPPQYPRNPTHEDHRALVLYIVRVPGSKDVFLTPLKPPTKASISLAAIQASLYYLHVNGPGDEEVRQSVEQERIESKGIGNTANVIHRKPLPTVPHENYPSSRRPLPPPKSYPSYQPGPNGNTDSSQLGRYITRGSNVTFNGVGSQSSGIISRKPAGPRRFSSLVEESHDEVSEFQSSHDPGLRMRAFDDSPAVDDHFPGTRSNVRTDTLFDNENSPPTDQRPSTNHMGTRSYAPITLIRRDPSSGAQWNIGVITDGGRLTESPLRSVNILLDVPGYSKFIGQQDITQTAHSSDAGQIKALVADAQPAGDPTYLPGNKNFVRSVEFRQQQFQGRQTRLQSLTSPVDTTPNFPVQNKPPRSVLSFYSPWQGLCSFSNGIDGRSLKCRHALPSTRVDEDSESVNVAELRFNLAWSALRSRDPNRRNSDDNEDQALPISQLLKEPRGGKEAFRKGIKHIKTLSRDIKDRRNRTSSFENEPVPPALPSRPLTIYEDDPHDRERVSLKLGREKAGGGYRGNSAKLGKLIIEDEGLKMGDLVVAACMGIWWQHYLDQEY